MATVLRIDSMAGSHYDFQEWEVADMEEWTYTKQIKQLSQLGDPSVFDEGVEHYYSNVTFQLTFAGTVARLNLIRQLRDRFWIFPHYLFDTDEKYCVILWNPEAIREYWRRGHPLADQRITLHFREFVGAVCVPPPLVS